MKRSKSEPICPIIKVATILSDTWTILIMHSLMSGAKRFCEIEAELKDISTRTLTNKLKQLLQDGLVAKDDFGRYVATKKGTGLKLIEAAMVKYHTKYLQK